MKFRTISGLTTLVAALIIFATLAPTAEAQRRHAVTRHNITFGSLTGVVTDSASSEPLAGATVNIRNTIVHTNEDGEYTFEKLATGAVTATVDRWGYEGIDVEVQINEGTNNMDFSLDLLPAVVLTRTDGSVEHFAVDTVTWGYTVTFVGTFDSPTLTVCTGDPNAPIQLEVSDLAAVYGPATRVSTPCCSKFDGEQISILKKDGTRFDAVILDSCPPYTMYFIGRSFDRSIVVYSRLEETESIEFPPQ